MKEMQIKERDNGIYLIKLIATIAVVMIHGKNIYGYAGVNTVHNHLVKSIAFIMTTGVPLFYISSGYLWGIKSTQKTVNIKAELSKTLKTLIIPYVIVNIIWLCFEIIISLTVRNFSEINSVSIIECISYITYRPIYSPFWFIRNLIMLRIISILLACVHSDLSKYVFIVMVVIGLIMPLPIDNYGRVTLIYYGLGVILGQGHLETAAIIYAINKKTLVITLAVAALCLITIQFTDNAFILRILTLLLTLSEAAIMLSYGRKYNGMCWLDLVASNSFFIYAFHGKVLSALQIIAVKVLPQSQAILFFEYVGFPVLVIMFLIFVSVAVKRHLPNCYKLVTGGR